MDPYVGANAQLVCRRSLNLATLRLLFQGYLGTYPAAKGPLCLRVVVFDNFTLYQR